MVSKIKTYLNKRDNYSESGEMPQDETGDVRRQIAKVSGTEAFNDRDPIWHLDESFCQTFDLAGQKRAMESDRSGENKKSGGEKREETNEGESFLNKDSRTDFNNKYEPRKEENEPQVRGFAETAFKRGQLSSAVVAGTAKTMFFSCLNRTVGQQDAKNRKERKLFQKESLHRKVPGNDGAKLIVNRGEAESAVGLVVDSLKDARWTLKSMQDIAEGRMGAAGAETYRKQYPFLTDSGERALIAEYRDKLEGAVSLKEKQALNSGIIKLQHVIEKKEQMKRRFLEHLKKLQFDALTAEQMFLSEDFLSSVYEADEPSEAPDDADNNDDGDIDPKES